jgi:hypothetical protein
VFYSFSICIGLKTCFYLSVILHVLPNEIQNVHLVTQDLVKLFRSLLSRPAIFSLSGRGEPKHFQTRRWTRRK